MCLTYFPPQVVWKNLFMETLSINTLLRIMKQPDENNTNNMCQLGQPVVGQIFKMSRVRLKVCGFPLVCEI